MRKMMKVVAVVALIVGWALPAAAQDAKVAQGEKLFAANKCSICHSVAGKGNVKHPLDGVAVAKKPSAEMVRMWLTDPKGAEAKAAVKAVPPMKSFKTLPAADIDALVAYVLSLK